MYILPPHLPHIQEMEPLEQKTWGKTCFPNSKGPSRKSVGCLFSTGLRNCVFSLPGGKCLNIAEVWMSLLEAYVHRSYCPPVLAQAGI